MPAGVALDPRVLVGAGSGDDAGVMLLDDGDRGGRALIGTTDFITPVCDEPERYGRVAAANALSDVFAMGGEALFALNLCMFPKEVPDDALRGILAGADSAVREAGAVTLGGHSVRDRELRFGLAVVGSAPPDRLLRRDGARAGDALVLTKPLGTGVYVNAYRADRLDAAGLEPALVEMERLNLAASRLALAHGAHAATDVTGFGLLGHALGMARGAGVALEIRFAALPIHPRFAELVAAGVSTGSTRPNEAYVRDVLELRAAIPEALRDVLFDPQTSGGLLVALPADAAEAFVAALRASGHDAAAIGRVLPGPVRIAVV